MFLSSNSSNVIKTEQRVLRTNATSCYVPSQIFLATWPFPSKVHSVHQEGNSPDCWSLQYSWRSAHLTFYLLALSGSEEFYILEQTSVAMAIFQLAFLSWLSAHPHPTPETKSETAEKYSSQSFNLWTFIAWTIFWLIVLKEALVSLMNLFLFARRTFIMLPWRLSKKLIHPPHLP